MISPGTKRRIKRHVFSAVRSRNWNELMTEPKKFAIIRAVGQAFEDLHQQMRAALGKRVGEHGRALCEVVRAARRPATHFGTNNTARAPCGQNRCGSKAIAERLRDHSANLRRTTMRKSLAAADEAMVGLAANPMDEIVHGRAGVDKGRVIALASQAASVGIVARIVEPAHDLLNSGFDEITFGQIDHSALRQHVGNAAASVRQDRPAVRKRLHDHQRLSVQSGRIHEQMDVVVELVFVGSIHGPAIFESVAELDQRGVDSFLARPCTSARPGSAEHRGLAAEVREERRAQCRAPSSSADCHMSQYKRPSRAAAICKSGGAGGWSCSS